MKYCIPLLCMALLLCGCSTHTADTTQVHKMTMKRFETMINTADHDLARELVADDAPFHTPASPAPLYGGEGYVSVVDWMRQAFPDVQWKLEDMVAEGNTVAVRWTLSGTHKGEFLGMPATGRRFSTSVMNFYFFNDEGKIINDIAAEGMIGILRGIGMLDK